MHAGHDGPNVDRMRSTEATPLERSLGLEIQSEARLKGMTHRAIQNLAGITDRSFRRWFVTGDRHIPFEELEKVAGALRVPISELVARAEANVEAVADAMEEARLRDLLADKALSGVERADLQKVLDDRWPDNAGGSPSSTRGNRTGT